VGRKALKIKQNDMGIIISLKKNLTRILVTAWKEWRITETRIKREGGAWTKKIKSPHSGSNENQDSKGLATEKQVEKGGKRKKKV